MYTQKQAIEYVEDRVWVYKAIYEFWMKERNSLIEAIEEE